MTTEIEIDDQIKKDYSRMWNSPYEGKLPEGVLQKFREAIMLQSPITLQGAPMVMRDLLQTKEYDLKFFQVGVILNTIFSTPFERIFYTPEEALDALIEYKEIEIEYNNKVSSKQKEIEKKRARLLSLSGVTKTIHLNGKN